MSYEIVNILTPTFIKDATTLHSNVDDNLLTPIIQDCQNIFIEKITGSLLLDEIIEQISAGTLTAANKTLIDDHLVNAILRWVVGKYLRQETYRKTNRGTVVMSGDGASTASDKELIDQSQDYLDRAEHYAQRATLFLMENEDLYPLYCDSSDKIDTIRPSRNQYRSGFYLGNDDLLRSD